MRAKLMFSVSALLIAIPSAALGQDFDGTYVGVQGGWEQTDLRNPETDLGMLTLDRERQSFTGGIFAGYDRQVGPRIVLGAEAGVDVSADDEVRSTTGTGLISVDPQWSVDLTARAGYLLDGRTLAYLRGGYTNARVETNLGTGAAELSETEQRNGWLVGAGIERRILQNISGRLEYRYSDLSEGDGTFDRHRLLAGIAYRF